MKTIKRMAKKDRGPFSLRQRGEVVWPQGLTSSNAGADIAATKSGDHSRVGSLLLSAVPAAIAAWCVGCRLRQAGEEVFFQEVYAQKISLLEKNQRMQRQPSNHRIAGTAPHGTLPIRTECTKTTVCCTCYLDQAMKYQQVRLPWFWFVPLVLSVRRG
jgi:hypothetical protein